MSKAEQKPLGVQCAAPVVNHEGRCSASFNIMLIQNLLDFQNNIKQEIKSNFYSTTTYNDIQLCPPLVLVVILTQA